MPRGQFIGGILLGGLIGGLLSIWAILPSERSSKNGFMFEGSMEEVWDVFTDPASQASWRSDIKSVEMIRQSGYREWIEHPQNGPSITFKETNVSPVTTFSLTMEAEGAFTGQYTARFEPQTNGRTMGYFSETVQLQGLVPKIMSYLFVDQREFTWNYCLNAQAEIDRRRAEKKPEPLIEQTVREPMPASRLPAWPPLHETPTP